MEQDKNVVNKLSHHSHHDHQICGGGCCGNKALKIVVSLLIALLFFALGVGAGLHLSRSYGSQAGCGYPGGMMRGNRGRMMQNWNNVNPGQAVPVDNAASTTTK